MSSCSEASKAGAVPTPKNKSKNFTLSLNECFPTVYFYTPVAVCIAVERECEGWEGRNEDRQGKTGQGGGVAECHPVIGESAPLVLGARRLNREREFWQKQAGTHLHSSFELGAVPVRHDRGKGSLVGKRHKSYTAFYPKAKAIHRRHQLYLITTRWCNNERHLPPTGLHFLFFPHRGDDIVTGINISLTQTHTPTSVMPLEIWGSCTDFRLQLYNGTIAVRCPDF